MLPPQPRVKVKELALLIGLNLLMAVVKPVIFSKAFQGTGFSQATQKVLTTSEWVRQGVGSALWMMSLCVSFALTEKLLPDLTPLAKLLSSTLISSVPDTFLRPVLTAQILKSLFKHGMIKTKIPV